MTVRENARALVATADVPLVAAAAVAAYCLLAWLVVDRGRVLPVILFDFDRRIAAFGLGNANPFLAAAMMLVFVVLHAWSWRIGGFANRLDAMGPRPRIAVYFVAILALLCMWPAGRTAFIYFQF